MLIKDSGSRIFLGKKVKDALSRLVKNKKKVLFVLYSIFLLSLAANINLDAVFKNTLKPMFFDGFRVTKNFLKGLTARPEHIAIDIKHIDFQKLAYKREKALARGLLFKEADDYVPAFITYNGKTYRASIRLKGDLVEHLKGDKWSFRVRIKGENTILGMKQFSLQHPMTRKYIYEWIFHKFFKKEKLLFLRYKFFKVILNGKDLGVYALEEHFEKRLIESNNLREGPIIRFNEDLFWREMIKSRKFKIPLNKEPHELPKTFDGTGSYLSSDIDAFYSSRMHSDPELFYQYLTSINLLESFRKGLLKTSDVFDIAKLGKYFALTDLLGAEHGSRWHNARFYYNPITSWLEPIPYDANIFMPIKSLCVTKGYGGIGAYSNYYKTLFADKVFFEEYIKNLEQMSKASYLDEFFAEVEKDLSKNLDIIYSEFPTYRFSKSIFYINQYFIRSMLNPPKAIHAYLKDSEQGKGEVSLGNIHLLPVEVLSVSQGDKVIHEFEQPVFLPEKIPTNLVEYKNLKFSLSQGIDLTKVQDSKLKVNYRILGTSYVRSEDVFPWPYLSEDYFEKDLFRQEIGLDGLEFILVDEPGKRIAIKPGSWTIKKPLIIPEGYTFICGEGVSLNLENSSLILAYSPLEFIGSADNPIRIYSEDSTGQGLIVIGARGKSFLKEVVFEKLSNPKRKGWVPTGSVTFYESSVNILKCRFKDNVSEDSLNIIRSTFNIDKTIFEGTSSDALDIDFSKGRVNQSFFIDCVNDAIDISGSLVSINECFIDGAGDKGISVGERSKVNIINLDIKNSHIAVASKDSSSVNIKNINLSACNIGLAVYKKKPEFGPSFLFASGLKLSDVNSPYLVENRSVLVVEGNQLTANQDNLAEKLYEKAVYEVKSK